MPNDYANEIRKTGFVLENQVADAFKMGGWNIISNKYYEDDFEGSVREIDLLVYKATKIQHVHIYTSLLISCKKSDTNIWALLAREIDAKPPNSDWWPLHAWSNDKAISYKLAQPHTPKDYHQELKGNGLKAILGAPEFEVFAFQEMNKNTGAPQNDKNIYNSITSLMKAQSYELGALPQRKKSTCCYQFNLISIIDSELFRLLFINGDIQQEEIDTELYISRYIIKRKETFSRIRFVAASALKILSDEYTKLHEENCKWFDSSIDSFYRGILEDFERTDLLLPEFIKEVQWAIYGAASKLGAEKVSRDRIALGWDQKHKLPIVSFPEIDPYIDDLNKNEILREKIGKSFKKIYRYDGNFDFDEDPIPF